MKHTTTTVSKELLSKHLYVQEGQLYRTYKYSAPQFELMDDTLVADTASIAVTTGEYPLTLNIRRVAAVMILEGLDRKEARELLDFELETKFSKWFKAFKQVSGIDISAREARLMSAAFHQERNL